MIDVDVEEKNLENHCYICKSPFYAHDEFYSIVKKIANGNNFFSHSTCLTKSGKECIVSFCLKCFKESAGSNYEIISDKKESENLSSIYAKQYSVLQYPSLAPQPFVVGPKSKTYNDELREEFEKIFK